MLSPVCLEGRQSSEAGTGHGSSVCSIRDSQRTCAIDQLSLVRIRQEHRMDSTKGECVPGPIGRRSELVAHHASWGSTGKGVCSEERHLSHC